MTQEKGFFGRLFDFSFSEFVALKIVSLLYGLGIGIAGIISIAVIIGGFSQGSTPGFIALIVSPIVFLLYVIFIRIGLEAFVASIRTAENTGRIYEHIRRTGEGL
ncbi:MAG: DUF4282 domain-containing protein [Cyanobacteria bacterium SBLK]|nr:DUF4282 domain-containing protein [Cyanobacteria bacterium SBLK]